MEVDLGTVLGRCGRWGYAAGGRRGRAPAPATDGSLRTLRADGFAAGACKGGIDLVEHSFLLA